MAHPDRSTLRSATTTKSSRVSSFGVTCSSPNTSETSDAASEGLKAALVKAAGMECAEYLTLEEALARHKSEGTQEKLRERYARGQKLCKVRVRRGYDQKQSGELIRCSMLIAEYERNKRQ